MFKFMYLHVGADSTLYVVFHIYLSTLEISNAYYRYLELFLNDVPSSLFPSPSARFDSALNIALANNTASAFIQFQIKRR